MSKYSIKYIKEDGSVALSNDWIAGPYLISASCVAVGSGTSGISATSGGGILFDGSNFYGWNGTSLISLDTQGAVPGGSDRQIQFNDGGTLSGTAGLTFTTGNELQLSGGVGITAFSSDGTMAGNSDDVVPTEAAVVTFVQAATAASHVTPGGANRYIQFNDNGSFGGILNFYLNTDYSLLMFNSPGIVSYNNGGNWGIAGTSYSSNAQNGSNISLTHVRGTQSSPSTTLTYDLLGSIQFGGGGAWGAGTSVRFGAWASEDWTTTSARGGEFRLYTTPNGSFSPVWAMTITHSGSVGLKNGTATIYERLDLPDASGIGAIRIGDAVNTVSGTIKYDGNYWGHDGSDWVRLDLPQSIAGSAATAAQFISKEPMGFPNRTDSVISFDNATRTLWITAAAGSASTFEHYFQGKKYTTTAASAQIADSTGTWYFYFDEGTLTATSATSWGGDYGVVCQVAIVYWNGLSGNGALIEERHGLTMDWATHQWAHLTIGTRYGSGLTISATVNGTGNNNTDATVQLTSGSIFDEDLRIDITDSSGSDFFNQILSPTAQIPVVYLSGGPGYIQRIPASDFPVYYDGTRITYNEFSGGSWQISTVQDRYYVAVWFFASNSTNSPVIAFMGQREDDKLIDAEANNTLESLSFGNTTIEELKVLYRVIYQTRNIYGNDVKARIVHIEDLRSVSNLPAGTYVATDHGSLAGLADDDHPQYILADSTRSMEAAWNIGQAISATSGNFTGKVSVQGLTGAGAIAFESTGVIPIVANRGSVTGGFVYQDLYAAGSMRWRFGSNTTSHDLLIKNASTTTLLTIKQAGKIELQNGTDVDEFSTDGTMADNSDDAVPTEAAVVTYVQAATAAATASFSPAGSDRQIQFNDGGSFAGSPGLTFTTGNELQLSGGVGITAFSSDGTMAGNSDDVVPTEAAVVTFVQAATAAATGTASAGGNDTEIQYNDSGVLAGSSKLVFNGTEIRLNDMEDLFAYRSDGNSFGFFGLTYSNTASKGSNIQLAHRGGSFASPGTTNSGDTLGSIMFGGGWAASWGTSTKIQSQATEEWVDSDHRGSNLKFFTTPNGASAGVCMLALTDTGRVGVGTETPGLPVDIVGNVDSNAIFRYRNYTNTDGTGTLLQLARAKGTPAAAQAVADGDTISGLLLYGHDGGSFAQGANIVAYAAGAWTSASRPCELKFSTRDTTGDVAVRMIIAEDGVIYVANASTMPTYNPVAGALIFASAGALMARGDSGTVTVVGPAAPHCPNCGRDYILQWENPEKGEKLMVCMWCLVHELGAKNYIKRIKRIIPSPDQETSSSSGSESNLGILEVFEEKEINVLDSTLLSTLQKQIQALTDRISSLEASKKET